MKLKLLITLLLFLTQILFANDIGNSKTNFTLTIEIWPSFYNSAIVTISSVRNNQLNLRLEEIRYDANYNSSPDQQTINSYKVTSKSDLLREERMKKYIESDSVYIKTVEEIIITDSRIIKKILKYDLKNQRSLLMPDNTIISDGIELYFKYQSDQNLNYFQFDDIKDEKKELGLLQLVFDLTLNYFKKNDALLYIEKLTASFNLGIQSRIVSDMPLEYRVFGVAYFEDYKSVKRFIKKLPKNEPIILDLTNYLGTEVFFDELEEFLETKNNRKIYLLVNEHWHEKIEYYDYEWNGVNFFTNRDDIVADISKIRIDLDRSNSSKKKI